MAKCRRCGKRTWARDLCPDCALLLETEGSASARQRPDSSIRESRETIIHRSSSTNITIVIDGKPVSVSADEGATPELLQRLSAELDLPEHQLEGLLGKAFEQLGEEPAAPVRASGPLRKVTCPGCERTVPDRNGWCMYCGAELVREQAAPAPEIGEEASEVDRAFLEGEVRPPEPGHEEREKVRETYRDRLSEL